MADFLIRVTRQPRGCGRRPHAAAPIAAALLTAGLVLVAAPDCADGGEPAPPGLPPGRVVEDLDGTAAPSLLSFVRDLKAAAEKGPAGGTGGVQQRLALPGCHWLCQCVRLPFVRAVPESFARRPGAGKAGGARRRTR